MSAIGRVVREMSQHVVPAKAGTHNHRPESLRRGGTASLRSHESLWLWVPDRARCRSLVRDDNHYDLKKLLAASFDARFFVVASCSRAISPLSSAMRSWSSSTESSDRSCPIP